jgi:hypothetical protein
MKTRLLFLLSFICCTLTACGDSTITSEYDTVKAKKIILEGEDGKEYEITVDRDGEVKTKEVR